MKPIKGKVFDAKQFIAKKTKGRKVFLKYDAIEFDNNKNRLCYLYLKSKLSLTLISLKFDWPKRNSFDYKKYKRF